MSRQHNTSVFLWCPAIQPGLLVLNVIFWSGDLTTLNWSGNVSDLLLSQQFYSFIKLKLTVCSGKCPEWVDVVLTRLKDKHSHNWLQSPPLSSILQTKNVFASLSLEMSVFIRAYRRTEDIFTSDIDILTLTWHHYPKYTERYFSWLISSVSVRLCENYNICQSYQICVCYKVKVQGNIV